MRKLAVLAWCSLGTGCAWQRGSLAPDGPKALDIAQLGALFFWIETVVLALVVVAAVWAFWHGTRRAAGNHEPALVLKSATEQRLTRAVGASTIVALLLLALLLVASIKTGRNLSEFLPPKPLHVKVTAHQWWWKIEYPGASPDREVTAVNELHVPAGRPIQLELLSNDVIHSFWIPRLDGKHDLIPGRAQWTMLQADEPGQYSGRCAEFCGYQHAHMDLLLIADPPGRFEAWLDSQRATAPEPQTPSARHGKDIVEHSPCAACHNISGTLAAGNVAPDLTHFASRHSLAAGAADMSRASLKRWLENPQLLKPGSQMPAVDLSPADLDAVTDYLETLK